MLKKVVLLSLPGEDIAEIVKKKKKALFIRRSPKELPIEVHLYCRDGDREWFWGNWLRHNGDKWNKKVVCKFRLCFVGKREDGLDMWMIEGLEEFRKPRSLEEYRKVGYYEEKTLIGYLAEDKAFDFALHGLRNLEEVEEHYKIRKAPTAWQYAEDLKGEQK